MLALSSGQLARASLLGAAQLVGSQLFVGSFENLTFSVFFSKTLPLVSMKPVPEHYVENYTFSVSFYYYYPVLYGFFEGNGWWDRHSILLIVPTFPGWFPLHEAVNSVKHDALKIVKLLLKHG